MIVNFGDVARRIETGQLMSSDDFHMKLLAPKIMELVKEHKIDYDPNQYTCLDNSMVDAVWEAGLELFLHTGFYAVNSRRQVQFSEEEVKEGLKNTITNFALGEGADQRKFYPRKIEDSRPPLIFGGPFNCDVEESMFVPFNEAYAKEPIIDVLFLPGHLRQIGGVEIRMNSPIESRAAIRYASLTKEAIRRAGRPFMPVVVHPCMGLNALATTNEEWGFRKYDIRAATLISELGAQDIDLSQITCYHEYGYPLYLAATPLIGGFAGGPAGASILGVAAHIANVVLGAWINHLGPQHVKYGQQTNKHSLWQASLVKQAIAKHSNIISITSHTTTGRPGQKQFFYEMTALLLSVVPSGSHICGPRPATPIRLNQNSPLCARYFGEVGIAAAKLNRKKAAEIIPEIYKKYGDKLEFEKVEKGNTFEELYNLETLQPTPEHYAQYQEVKKEMADLGLKL